MPFAGTGNRLDLPGARSQAGRPQVFGAVIFVTKIGAPDLEVMIRAPAFNDSPWRTTRGRRLPALPCVTRVGDGHVPYRNSRQGPRRTVRPYYHPRRRTDHPLASFQNEPSGVMTWDLRARMRSRVVLRIRSKVPPHLGEHLELLTFQLRQEIPADPGNVRRMRLG